MTLRHLKYFCDGPPAYGLNVPADKYLPSGIRFLRTTDVSDDGRLASDASGGVFLDPREVPSAYMLRDGDLLLSRSGTLGRSLLFIDLGTPTTHAGYLVRFRPSQTTHPPYLAYCAQSKLMQDAVGAEAITSTIANFNAEKYANVQLPWWPRSTQRAISDYLDRETARLDALTGAKKQMLTLARERLVAARRAHFDNGVAETTAVPLRRLVTCLDGSRIPLNREERALRPGPYPYWGAGSVVDTIDSYIFDEELVLLGEDGAPFFDDARDVAFKTEGRIWVNNHIHVLRCRSATDAGWLCHMLNAVDYAAYISGSTRDKLTQDEMMEIRLPALDANAQVRLRKELDAIERRTLWISQKLMKQVTLLREHRRALITAAVTGQRDIPDAA